MRALRGVFVLVLALVLPAHVLAADYQAGLNAYKRGDYATALQEWRPLAEQGVSYAQYNLGGMYYDGTGVPQDYAAAAKWYWLAAEQGMAGAQSNLGTMYDNGQGVPQNYAEAAELFRLAAEQGYANAQVNLGAMYVDGTGVARDYVQALMWFKLAAARLPPGEDRDRAIHNRDIAERNMTPEQITEAQRLASEWNPK